MDKVSILLSIYKPNMIYLKEQLLSLNNQTYSNIELVVWNDCPEQEIDRDFFNQCITRFPIRFYDNKVNLGYIGAFSKLSELAEGEYVSYCDQDDIWEPEKVAKCIQVIQDSKSVASVCDKALMSADGEIYIPSYRQISKMACDCWNTGDDITTRAAFFCYGTGMTIIAKRRIVQRFLPLVPVVAHDLQLMLFLSAGGNVAYVDEPLVRYRRHGRNETGLLSGILSKKDYYDTRCVPTVHLLERFEELYPEYAALKDMKRCASARVRGNIIEIWRYRRMIPDLYRYEIALALCPNFVFRCIKDQFVRFKEKGSIKKL
ncbi:MAG: glycosyltransferase [Clostridia bacterium]|nr:glycosyltransferase [Clostridia bacterium]